MEEYQQMRETNPNDSHSKTSQKLLCDLRDSYTPLSQHSSIAMIFPEIGSKTTSVREVGKKRHVCGNNT
jgi:hypothetical protein